MLEPGFQSNRDLLLYGVPLIVLTLAGILRLDELFARPRKKRTTPARPPRRMPTPLPHGTEPDGQPFSLDGEDSKPPKQLR